MNANGYLLSVRGDNALSLGYNEYLVAGMDMELCPCVRRPVAKTRPEVFTRASIYQRLHRRLTDE